MLLLGTVFTTQAQQGAMVFKAVDYTVFDAEKQLTAPTALNGATITLHAGTITMNIPDIEWKHTFSIIERTVEEEYPVTHILMEISPSLTFIFTIHMQTSKTVITYVTPTGYTLFNVELVESTVNNPVPTGRKHSVNSL